MDESQINTFKIPATKQENKRIAKMVLSDVQINKKQNTSFGKLILGDERNSPVISKIK